MLQFLERTQADRDPDHFSNLDAYRSSSIWATFNRAILGGWQPHSAECFLFLSFSLFVSFVFWQPGKVLRVKRSVGQTFGNFQRLESVFTSEQLMTPCPRNLLQRLDTEQTRDLCGTASTSVTFGQVLSPHRHGVSSGGNKTERSGSRQGWRRKEAWRHFVFFTFVQDDDVTCNWHTKSAPHVAQLLNKQIIGEKVQ